jgi:hypothetical protein
MEVEEIDDDDDIIIIKETSTSARDSHSKQLPSTSFARNESVSEFPDEDFDFDDCEIIVEPKTSQRFSIYIFLCILNIYP